MTQRTAKSQLQDWNVTMTGLQSHNDRTAMSQRQDCNDIQDCKVKMTGLQWHKNRTEMSQKQDCNATKRGLQWHKGLQSHNDRTAMAQRTAKSQWQDCSVTRTGLQSFCNWLCAYLFSVVCNCFLTLIYILQMLPLFYNVSLSVVLIMEMSVSVICEHFPAA